MRIPLRPPLVIILLLSVVVLLTDSFRNNLLSVIRLPLTIFNRALNVIILLPRLPELSGENAELRSSLTKSSLELAKLHEVVRSYQQSTKLHDIYPSSKGVVASVISHSIIPGERIILIDKGLKAGIEETSVVVNDLGVVGRVVDLWSNGASVMLLTDHESRVAAIVERSREIGLLVGTSSNWCKLIYLSADSDIEVGDRVVTAGKGSLFPKGLLLGVIDRVSRDNLSGKSWARVKPSVRLGRLEEVFCLAIPARQDK